MYKKSLQCSSALHLANVKHKRLMSTVRHFLAHNSHHCRNLWSSQAEDAWGRGGAAQGQEEQLGKLIFRAAQESLRRDTNN